MTDEVIPNRSNAYPAGMQKGCEKANEEEQGCAWFAEDPKGAIAVT